MPLKHVMLSCVSALAWCGVCCAAASAVEGVPDPSFGRNGVEIYELGPQPGKRRSNSEFSAVGVFGAGKIYAAGASSEGPALGNVLLARITENGGLDPAFGGGHLVMAPKATNRRRT